MTGQATINNDGVSPGFYLKRWSLYVAELEKQVLEHFVLFSHVYCYNLLESCNNVFLCTGKVVCAFSLFILTHIYFLVCYIVHEFLMSDTFIKRKRRLM